MKKKVSRIVLPIIAIFVLYVLLDYLNIPTLMGIVPTNINADAFGVIFDAVIVLVLYAISFYYIENRQNEKDKNATDTAEVLIKKTYQECLANLEFLDNRQMIGKYIIPKIDGNKTDSENKVINNLQTLPFSSFDAVISLASDGYIAKVRIDDYLSIKKEYQYLVSLKITFFDLDNPQTEDQAILYNDIQTRDSAIRKKIKEFLNL